MAMKEKLTNQKESDHLNNNPSSKNHNFILGKEQQ